MTVEFSDLRWALSLLYNMVLVPVKSMNVTSMLIAGGRFGDYSRGWSITCWSASTSCPPGDCSLKIVQEYARKCELYCLCLRTICVKIIILSWGRIRSGWSPGMARDSGCRGICSGICVKFNSYCECWSLLIKSMSYFKCSSLAWRLFPSTAISAPILDFLPTRSWSRTWSTCILGLSR